MRAARRPRRDPNPPRFPPLPGHAFPTPALPASTTLRDPVLLSVAAAHAPATPAQVTLAWLWAQGVFHRREAAIRKTPGSGNAADLMTMFLDGARIQALMTCLGFTFQGGRSGLALKAAL